MKIVFKSILLKKLKLIILITFFSLGINVKQLVAQPFVYVTNNFGNSVSVINTTTNTITATISLQNKPLGLAITPDNEFVYVAIEQNSSVSVINTSTNTIVADILVGTNPFDVAITPDGNYAYVTNSLSNTVSVINTSTNLVTDNINVGNGPRGITITPNGQFAYVANYDGTTLSVINTTTNVVSETIDVGGFPEGIDITTDGKFAYVANYGDNTLSVVDIATNTVTSTVTGLSYPWGVAITSGATMDIYLNDEDLSTRFELYRNYPNPFNPSTKIKYSVPQSSNVVIKVFDILGNEIEELVKEEKPSGTYEITWYAEGLQSGVYFYQLKAGSFVETKKMILMK